MLTETVSNETTPVLLEATSPGEKIVKRKLIVYETRVDPEVTKLTAEKLKDQMFTRFGFLKPKPDEIQIVSIEKYFEPYLLITGKYSVDYYRKCVYHIRVDEGVLEAVLLGKKLEPEASTDSTQNGQKTIRLEGESA